MKDYEKLGAFYLGRQYDIDSGKRLTDLLLYDSKDLTTHAVCVGMTGSGKTGLCISLIEEAAIDSIPAIIIDVKGDLGNLMLSFPDLDPSNFQEWVDPGAATRNGMSVEQFAKKTAEMWKNGLADWDQDSSRIKKFRSSVDLAIYTPGSNAGLPLTVLRSFSAPSDAVLNNTDAFRERIMSTVSGLLALLNIKADPIQSREHILLSNILDHHWRAGQDLDMPGLIREIQNPPFQKVGFMDLESIYPEKDRFGLSMAVNNLLASPGFSSWMQGEPLDVQKMYYTAEGKPRISIISIAHLSDSERMFFVTILLNEVLAWMRSQPGTSSLRALLYMDEVFGYFPPTANPPSKQPMLTLLKQARAFGLGVVLATQNPVDLDYKGLSNAGTWFLGRLQTERDKARVLDGLEGAAAATGATFSRSRIEEILSNLGSRVFLLNNVHDDEPVIFQTRWALSYLRGPLTRDQISTLMEPRKAKLAKEGENPALVDTVNTKKEKLKSRPILPPEIEEYFIPFTDDLPGDSKIVYRPAIFGSARVHFINTRSKVDHWKDLNLLSMKKGTSADRIWDKAGEIDYTLSELETEPEEGIVYSDLPKAFSEPKNFRSWKTKLKNYIYRSHTVKLFKCPLLKEISETGETEGEFRTRLSLKAREERDVQIEKLRKKFTPKLARIQERIRKAEQRVEREKEQVKSQTLQTVISFGSSILGAVFGRKIASRANVNRAASSMKSAGRIVGQKGDVNRAKETVEALVEDMELLEEEFEIETDKLELKANPENLELDEVEIKPRKSDLSIDKIVLVWTPWRVDSTGIAERAF
jgi:Helicase HerA, central domain